MAGVIAEAASGVLRLHVDREGVVWYGDDRMPVARSGQGVAAFTSLLASGALGYRPGDVRAFRVLGVRRNASLLVALYGLVLRQEVDVRSVRVLSPSVCHTRARASDPGSVLGSLWQPEPPGRSHVLARGDVVTYAIAADLDANGGPSDVCGPLLRVHPAWPALSFVAGMDEGAACRLVVDILDPAWFRHPRRPDRPSRLHRHLGLDPGNARALLGEGLAGRNFHRFASAAGVWRNDRAAGADREAPGAFLWRVHDARPSLAAGVLAATRKLASFVSHVWLGASPRHPEAGFVPERFFRRDAEAAAYREQA